MKYIQYTHLMFYLINQHRKPGRLVLISKENASVSSRNIIDKVERRHISLVIGEGDCYIYYLLLPGFMLCL